MIQTITDAMRQAEERPVHWSELDEAPVRTPPADFEPFEFCECGCYPCACDQDDDVDDGPGLCGNCERSHARCVCDRLCEEDRERAYSDDDLGIEDLEDE